jgi:hypothetical protein
MPNCHPKQIRCNDVIHLVSQDAGLLLKEEQAPLKWNLGIGEQIIAHLKKSTPVKICHKNASMSILQ